MSEYGVTTSIWITHIRPAGRTERTSKRNEDDILRFHFGKLSWPEQESLTEAGWNRIQSPGSRVGYTLAVLAGVLIILLLFGWLIAVSLFASDNPVERTADLGNSPWGALILALLLFIPLHEIVHAISLPGYGLSPQTIVIIWPGKLRFGIYYEGCMSRSRWLMMRLTPFVCITTVTIGLLTLFYFIPGPYVIIVFLQILFMLNGLGSGGDIIAVIWVLFQAPAKSWICFYRGKAYWRDEEIK